MRMVVQRHFHKDFQEGKHIKTEGYDDNILSLAICCRVACPITDICLRVAEHSISLKGKHDHTGSILFSTCIWQICLLCIVSCRSCMSSSLCSLLDFWLVAYITKEISNASAFAQFTRVFCYSLWSFNKIKQHNQRWKDHRKYQAIRERNTCLFTGSGECVDDYEIMSLFLFLKGKERVLIFASITLSKYVASECILINEKIGFFVLNLPVCLIFWLFFFDYFFLGFLVRENKKKQTLLWNNAHILITTVIFVAFFFPLFFYSFQWASLCAGILLVTFCVVVIERACHFRGFASERMMLLRHKSFKYKHKHPVRTFACTQIQRHIQCWRAHRKHIRTQAYVCMHQYPRTHVRTGMSIKPPSTKAHTNENRKQQYSHHPANDNHGPKADLWQQRAVHSEYACTHY